jgi:(p)ppGpp synthase/HD superfamily hydrolase
LLLQGKVSVPLLFPALKGAFMAANPRWVPSPAFLKAFEAACLAHGRDARKINQEPYIGHLMGVASLVIEHNGTQEQAIAALLHDIIEDSPMTFDELEFEFGPGVRKIVEACTDATHEQKAEEKELRATLPKDKSDEVFWIRKSNYLKRLSEKDHTDPSVLVALADKVNNGEKSMLDLRGKTEEEIAEFRKAFNSGFEKQRDWYQGLADAFTTPNKKYEPLHQRLVDRFVAAVNEMYPR